MPPENSIRARNCGFRRFHDHLRLTLPAPRLRSWQFMYNEFNVRVIGVNSPTLINCTFLGNWAGAVGGGVAEVEGTNPTLINCLFSGNWAGMRGGAVYNYDGSPTLVNCTFGGNVSAADGGGLYNSFGAATLTNCILWGNGDVGGTDESAQIHVEIVPPLVSHSCIQGLNVFAGSGNVGLDPLLADPDGADDMTGTDDDNLRILEGSSCIDAGDNSVVSRPTDLDGNPRIVIVTTPTVDIGAYEFQQGTPIPTVSNIGLAIMVVVVCGVGAVVIARRRVPP